MVNDFLREDSSPQLRLSRRSDGRCPGPVRLQPRDRKLLTEVFLHRAAKRGHLLGLGFFTSISRCNRRCAVLVRHGLLRRSEAYLGGRSREAIYFAGPTSSPIIAAVLGVEVADVRRLLRFEPGPFSLEHALRVVDIRAAFSQGCLHAGFGLDWRHELLCRDSFEIRCNAHSEWQLCIVKPDGFLQMTRHDGGGKFSAFVEADLANVGARRIGQKFSVYRAFVVSKLFEQRYGEKDAAVITVTTGEKRRRSLQALVPRDCVAPRFLFTTFQELESIGPFGSIWYSRRESTARMLLP